MNHRLVNDDYKNLIKDLKKEKIHVDAVITDPPYNVSRDYQL
jgi:site-specific DNA-methyltransferase (adenine-specific)